MLRALVVVSFIGCGAQRPPAPCTADTPSAADHPKASAYQAVIDQATAAGVPGAVALVQESGGRTWIGAAGFSQLESRSPMQRCTPFPIASITKMLVAVTVLSFVEQGALHLDDRVLDLLPEAKDVKNAERATVRELLAHTSGIAEYTANPEQGLRSLNDPNRSWTSEEAVAFARGMPAVFTPGEGFSYSNTNYVLLGMIIEAMTGRPFIEALNERVLTQAGMQHTQFAFDADQTQLTSGYHDSRGNGTLVNTTAFRHPARTTEGGLVSTATDLGRFLDAWSHDRLLRPETRALMSDWTKSAVLPGGDGYGLGLVSHDGGRAQGHSGSSLRVVSFAYVTEGTSVVLLANVSSPPDGPIGKALDTAFNALLAEVQR